jgi:Gas vesicle protein G
MGLFKGLVLLPLAPVQGVVWVAEQLQAQADNYLLDPEPVMDELAQLEAALDGGAISEEEFLRQEDELLDRLDEIREARAARGLP